MVRRLLDGSLARRRMGVPPMAISLTALRWRSCLLILADWPQSIYRQMSRLYAPA
jgi:hypothetical protein